VKEDRFHYIGLTIYSPISIFCSGDVSILLVRTAVAIWPIPVAGLAMRTSYYLIPWGGGGISDSLCVRCAMYFASLAL